MYSLGGQIGTILSHNVFAYCMNNPVNMEDPSGKIPLALNFLPELIGGAIATVGAVLSLPVVIAGALILSVGFLIYSYCSSSSISSSNSSRNSNGGSSGRRTNKPKSNKPKGFDFFRKLKKYIGPAGAGKAWHHIVEQTPSNVSRFTAQVIHNINNIMKLDHGKGSIHAKISGYYSSIQPFTNGQTVRKWLSTQSFEEQYEFGMKIIRLFQNQ